MSIDVMSKEDSGAYELDVKSFKEKLQGKPPNEVQHFDIKAVAPDFLLPKSACW